ncbi:CDP-diacylglycerol--serine O-phosphatidyltransferase [Leptospira borgpetersenii]|uniref:CDP-diacylglycerol--serine O-phosphatidyltransferase n=3 Tax=Leptospira borgpetersenii TaxID=174 RepID=Q04RH5_LEPBJ|nr:CDP-diacylglycerol--serine O-phosphatidyltransferase [Leptospira borgpetersenii]EMO61048.1 CDP-diacylglycerol-serine O-phosphatidyltransferase [Leptospira borgpetersenii serovar Pomona str. 200901868]ABJ76495.1 CDP-diacylglycerol--serine O- phosphatidyltransferase [Leptospira borgpetersenii serovar Hardjo-bovis str. JB197]ABJ78590.1 CDP-diacylglycerol--serine O- phosphatidyltransferase [Leptospira borgpetersenii serovar Hardjo-bovis str. L550]AMX57860.1 CDP-diacylglycerol--serine O-phosphati
MKLKLSWVPNTLTLGNLTMGFSAMLVASEAGSRGASELQAYTLAGFFILLAALCDGLDGMAARALNATSELGADLDSLADLTAFGIAPGYLMYQMVLCEYKIDVFGKEDLFPIGMLVAAIFPICAAYRLARFNVTHDPKSFTGLPSPVAGVTVGFFPIFLNANSAPHWITISAFVAIAILMVSNIRYSKPQVVIRSKLNPTRLFLLVAGITILLMLVGFNRWPWLIYGLIFFYIFSGIMTFLIHLIQEFRVKLD